jgi:gluconokinase
MSTISPERASPPFILSLDIGTSSVRAALFDRLGRAVQGMESRQVHEIGVTPEGAAEADPDGLLEEVFGCLDRLLDLADRLPIRIEGVAACTLVNNILGVDENNRAITPLTTYADTRGEEEVPRLKSVFDETVVHDRTGCRFHSSYLPARFGWLARKNPGLFAKAARWVSLGEYLELKLFGKTAVSYSVASWTGLLDRFRLVWDSHLLAALPVKREMLSPLSDVSQSRRGLRFGFAERWPSLAEVPWFPAVGDGAAANIGSGCISSRQVALTMGTSSALRVVLNTPVPHLPAGLWCYRVDGQRSLLGGALTEGGGTYAWMKAALNLNAHPALEETLAGMEPDSHGLTILPFLAGERAPGWAGHARATVHGLSLATAPLDVLRAGMEAVAYRLALVFELLRPMIPGDPQIVASGGALLRSPAWLQIVTDVLGRPVGVSGVEETSGRGAALLALEALGQISSVEEVPNFVLSVHHPDPVRHGRYGEAMERQKELYRKLVGTAE